MCSKSSKFRNPTNSALQLPFKYNVHKGEQTRNKNCKEIRCPNSPYYLCEKQVSRCDTATPRHVGITDATDVPEILRFVKPAVVPVVPVALADPVPVVVAVFLAVVHELCHPI